ncbi:MAG: DUF4349 domain-containing protein [Patescibacteria group bacterium]
MSLNQKIVISIIVVILVITIGGMLLNGVGNKATEDGSGILPSTNDRTGLESVSPENKVSEGAPSSSDTTGTATTDSTDRLVVKTGQVDIVVKDVVENAKKIIQYAEKRGGWVVQSNIQEVETLPVAEVVVRVPSEDFEEAIAYIRGLAVKVNFEKSQGQDVTEEYTDLSSQLRNLEATEQQLLEIMKKATKIEDILTVQKEISNVRAQIEQTKGTILYLERSSETATITANLALSEELLPVPPSEKWRPGYVAKTVWTNVVAAWRNVSYAVITFFVYAALWLPLLVIAYLIYWLVRKSNKKGKK